MSLELLPESSRVWIFIADRKLEPAEQIVLALRLNNFVTDWKAHGNELSAGYEIAANSIVIIAVDESFETPSGCSIDKAFRLLTEFGAENGMDFFQRTSIVQMDENNATIYSKENAEKAFTNGELVPEQLVFDQQIADLRSYNSKKLIPFSESWLGKKLIGTKTNER